MDTKKDKVMFEDFGSKVFNDSTMKSKLPKDTYKALKKVIETGDTLTLEVANVVANAMKDWAVENGATHFTHWFQPMTGKTAEKHDSFLTPCGDGTAVAVFSGKELIQGEPDASSFPNGGLRATFEARGYTAWDCTSPAFIKDDSLCIPTIFCSYTGEALDKKTPLLRSMQAIDKEAVRLLRLFGDTETSRVTTTVGAEQEYFLIDKDLLTQRDDLRFSGRTLFGAMSSKGQELDDHYFGSIKQRVSNFMKDLDGELWKLGITSKTKHNEVAPAQHELAPIFTTTNVATDQNQLTMDIMYKLAQEHDLCCLLHEKPFAGVNGSGKHNNWSLSTDQGVNLLEPGKKPHENTVFLTFLTAIVAAVDSYAPLLRMTAATAGNDHRLGANEAPPAIISMFLGEQLDDIVRQIIAGNLTACTEAGRLDLGVDTLVKFKKDVTDRNRTSPFAFTGNKFEFRMTQSSGSISGANFVLNTIIAEKLSEISDQLEGAENFNEKLAEVLTETLTKHERIIFNGDGYAQDWVVEAEKRGLPNIKSAPEAIKYFSKPEYIDVFAKHGVLTEGELLARQEIVFEEYAKTINIEALTMVDMAKKQIIPAAIEFATSLAESMVTINSACPAANTSVQNDLLVEISEKISQAQKAADLLSTKIDEASELEDDIEAMSFAYKEEVLAQMAELRTPCDELEALVSKEFWPFPAYSDLLFKI